MGIDGHSFVYALTTAVFLETFDQKSVPSKLMNDFSPILYHSAVLQINFPKQIKPTLKHNTQTDNTTPALHGTMYV